MEQNHSIQIFTAGEEHLIYAEDICAVIAESAKVRGTGIAKRTPHYIQSKISEGKAVIALSERKEFAGFCYIESWGTEKDYVANSGLIVATNFRGMGLGSRIKRAAFNLSLKKFPNAKFFGITTNPAVMKINYQLGYRPVTFNQLTNDRAFWEGCKGCVNYDILQRTKQKLCLCTGMLFDPAEKQQKGDKANGVNIKRGEVLKSEEEGWKK